MSWNASNANDADNKNLSFLLGTDNVTIDEEGVDDVHVDEDENDIVFDEHFSYERLETRLKTSAFLHKIEMLLISDGYFDSPNKPTDRQLKYLLQTISSKCVNLKLVQIRGIQDSPISMTLPAHLLALVLSTKSMELLDIDYGVSFTTLNDVKQLANAIRNHPNLQEVRFRNFIVHIENEGRIWGFGGKGPNPLLEPLFQAIGTIAATLRLLEIPCADYVVKEEKRPLLSPESLIAICQSCTIEQMDLSNLYMADDHYFRIASEVQRNAKTMLSKLVLNENPLTTERGLDSVVLLLETKPNMRIMELYNSTRDDDTASAGLSDASFTHIMGVLETNFKVTTFKVNATYEQYDGIDFYLDLNIAGRSMFHFDPHDDAYIRGGPTVGDHIKMLDMVSQDEGLLYYCLKRSPILFDNWYHHEGDNNVYDQPWPWGIESLLLEEQARKYGSDDADNDDGSNKDLPWNRDSMLDAGDSDLPWNRPSLADDSLQGDYETRSGRGMSWDRSSVMTDDLQRDNYSVDTGSEDSVLEHDDGDKELPWNRTDQPENYESKTGRRGDDASYSSGDHDDLPWNRPRATSQDSRSSDDLDDHVPLKNGDGYSNSSDYSNESSNEVSDAEDDYTSEEHDDQLRDLDEQLRTMEQSFDMDELSRNDSERDSDDNDSMEDELQNLHDVEADLHDQLDMVNDDEMVPLHGMDGGSEGAEDHGNFPWDASHRDDDDDDEEEEDILNDAHESSPNESGSYSTLHSIEASKMQLPPRHDGSDSESVGDSGRSGDSQDDSYSDEHDKDDEVNRMSEEERVRIIDDENDMGWEQIAQQEEARRPAEGEEAKKLAEEETGRLEQIAQEGEEARRAEEAEVKRLTEEECKRLEKIAQEEEARLAKEAEIERLEQIAQEEEVRRLAEEESKRLEQIAQEQEERRLEQIAQEEEARRIEEAEIQRLAVEENQRLEQIAQEEEEEARRLTEEESKRLEQIAQEEEKIRLAQIAQEEEARRAEEAENQRLEKIATEGESRRLEEAAEEEARRLAQEEEERRLEEIAQEEEEKRLGEEESKRLKKIAQEEELARQLAQEAEETRLEQIAQEEEEKRLEKTAAEQEEEKRRLEGIAKEEEEIKRAEEIEAQRVAQIVKEEEARRLAEQVEDARKLAEEAEVQRLEKIAQEEARVLAEKKLAEEAEIQRLEKLAKEEEAERLVEEEEMQRLEMEAEAKRLDEEAAQAQHEANRLAEEMEAQRIVDEEKAEAKRLELEREAQRVAEEEEEKTRLFNEAEVKERLAEAEEKARLLEEAEDQRIAQEIEATRLGEEEKAKLAQEEKELRLQQDEEAKQAAKEEKDQRLENERAIEEKRQADDEARRMATILAIQLAEQKEAANRLEKEKAEAERIAEEEKIKRLAAELAAKKLLEDQDMQRRVAEEDEAKQRDEAEKERLAKEAETQRMAGEKASRKLKEEEATRQREEEVQRVAAVEAELKNIARGEKARRQAAKDEVTKKEVERIAAEKELASRLAAADEAKSLAEKAEERKMIEEQKMKSLAEAAENAAEEALDIVDVEFKRLEEEQQSKHEGQEEEIVQEDGHASDKKSINEIESPQLENSASPLELTEDEKEAIMLKEMLDAAEEAQRKAEEEAIRLTKEADTKLAAAQEAEQQARKAKVKQSKKLNSPKRKKTHGTSNPRDRSTEITADSLSDANDYGIADRKHASSAIVDNRVGGSEENEEEQTENMDRDRNDSLEAFGRGLMWNVKQAIKPIDPSSQLLSPNLSPSGKKTRFLGGLFGRKKREQMLQMEKNQQEELINQQLKALGLEKEVNEADEINKSKNAMVIVADKEDMKVDEGNTEVKSELRRDEELELTASDQIEDDDESSHLSEEGNATAVIIENDDAVSPTVQTVHDDLVSLETNLSEMKAIENINGSSSDRGGMGLSKIENLDTNLLTPSMEDGSSAVESGDESQNSEVDLPAGVGASGELGQLEDEASETQGGPTETQEATKEPKPVGSSPAKSPVMHNESAQKDIEQIVRESLAEHVEPEQEQNQNSSKTPWKWLQTMTDRKESEGQRSKSPAQLEGNTKEENRATDQGDIKRNLKFIQKRILNAVKSPTREMTKEKNPPAQSKELNNVAKRGSVVEKWIDRSNHDPNDYEAECKQLIDIIFDNDDIDVEAMMSKSTPRELYSYLKQQQWYMIYTGAKDGTSPAIERTTPKRSKIIDLLSQSLHGRSHMAKQRTSRLANVLTDETHSKPSEASESSTEREIDKKKMLAQLVAKHETRSGDFSPERPDLSDDEDEGHPMDEESDDDGPQIQRESSVTFATDEASYHLREKHGEDDEPDTGDEFAEDDELDAAAQEEAVQKAKDEIFRALALAQQNYQDHAESESEPSQRHEVSAAEKERLKKVREEAKHAVKDVLLKRLLEPSSLPQSMEHFEETKKSRQEAREAVHEVLRKRLVSGNESRGMMGRNSGHSLSASESSAEDTARGALERDLNEFSRGLDSRSRSNAPSDEDIDTKPTDGSLSDGSAETALKDHSAHGEVTTSQPKKRDRRRRRNLNGPPKKVSSMLSDSGDSTNAAVSYGIGGGSVGNIRSRFEALNKKNGKLSSRPARASSVRKLKQASIKASMASNQPIQEENIGPTLEKDDVCTSISGHPGTCYLRKVVKAYLTKFGHREFGPREYKTIKRRLETRRFMVPSADDEEGEWREATKQERIDFVSKIFDFEKGRLEINKNSRSRSNSRSSKRKPKTVQERRALKNSNSSLSDEAFEIVEPGNLDVCMGVPDHPGSIAFASVLRSYIKKKKQKEYTINVYTDMRKRIGGSRMLTVHDDEYWRLATDDECIEYVGMCFLEATDGS